MSVDNDVDLSNPDNLPLEKLSLCVSSSGVIRQINALDPYWVEKRVLTLYEHPPDTNVIGATDAWKLRMEGYREDLRWLLSLEHHRFWSTILHHPSAMDMLVSFLQEAAPPYLPPPPPPARALYEDIRRYVLVVFCRLSTNKESKSSWISKAYMSGLLYDHFVFTVPILWDLCLVYAADNAPVVSRLVSSVFALQPKYLGDLDAAVAFVKEAFKYIILQVNRDYESAEPPSLPETFRGFSDIRRPGAAGPGASGTGAGALRDLAVHLLDAAMTVRLFVQAYPPAVDVLRERGFVLCIAQVYEHAIPQLYELLADTDAEPANQEASARASANQEPPGRASANQGPPGRAPANQEAALRQEATNHVEAARGELLDIFSAILDESKKAAFSGDRSAAAVHAERYLSALHDALAERLLLQDHHAARPALDDLAALSERCPDVDTVKIDFILQAIYANLDEPVPQRARAANGHLETLDNRRIDNQHIDNRPIDNRPIDNQDIPHNVRRESLITEVKDIFPDLGDGFIQKCLDYYDFNSERVVNSILEDNLAESLRCLDRSLPLIPEDPVDQQFLQTGIERLNVFDGDEFDIMTRDDVDLTRMHKGKKRSQYKDMGHMLDDKTEVKKMVDIYSKYNLVCDESAAYSDEYDDSWDDPAAARAGRPTDPGDPADPADPGDLGRPFVTPRALRPRPERAEVESSSSSSEEEAGPSRNRMDFCVNPEELRARREAAYRARGARGHRPPPRAVDLAGRARGLGQDAATLQARERKARHKAAAANHSRRDGAQWKRGRGMMS